MSAELEGRVAVVTGASRGIGRAIALELAARGCDLAFNFRSRGAEDVAQAGAFLLGPGGRYITGQVLVVDGGLSS